jgi:hypothetical protein
VAKPKITQALIFTVPNKVGQLSAVSELLAEANVNIDAIVAVESGSSAEFCVITAKKEKAKKALSPLGTDVREESVVCVQMANKAGRLGKAAKKLAHAGVNVSRAWASAFGGKSATLVLQTSDDKKAVEALTKK